MVHKVLLLKNDNSVCSTPFLNANGTRFKIAERQRARSIDQFWIQRICRKRSAPGRGRDRRQEKQVSNNELCDPMSPDAVRA